MVECIPIHDLPPEIMEELRVYEIEWSRYGEPCFGQTPKNMRTRRFKYTERKRIEGEPPYIDPITFQPRTIEHGWNLTVYFMRECENINLIGDVVLTINAIFARGPIMVEGE